MNFSIILSKPDKSRGVNSFPKKSILPGTSALKYLGTNGFGFWYLRLKKSGLSPLAISRLSLKPLVVTNPVNTPFLSVIELITTVVPCAKKVDLAISTFPFSIASKTPFS